MNSLARNLAARFSDRYAIVIKDFSKVVYNKLFFEKIDENKFVTVEKFIPGTFRKYSKDTLKAFDDFRNKEGKCIK